MQLLLKKHLFLILIFLAVIVTIFITRMNDDLELSIENNESETFMVQEGKSDVNESDNLLDLEETTYIVDVKGEVSKPGVYPVEAGARVVDVIDLAGGFTEKASQNNINLAEKVYDEMVVFIPEIGVDSLAEGLITSPGKSETPGIRINQATLEEVQTLNGVGPAKAEAIIMYRDENGPFKSVEDLLNVSGIGEKTLANFKDNVIVP